MTTVTPKDVIDYILEGEAKTKPCSNSFYSEDYAFACALGAGRVAFILEKGLTPSDSSFKDTVECLDMQCYLDAEIRLRAIYEEKYDTSIFEDNDDELGRELTIQRIKDLYSEVD